MAFNKARTRMKEMQIWYCKQKSAFETIRGAPCPPRLPSGLDKVCTPAPRPHPQSTLSGREARPCPDYRLTGEAGGERESRNTRLDAEGPRDKEQTPHTWPQLPSCARSLLVSTSTSGWAGGRRAGTVISIHLDCSLATKARRDGDLIPSQTGISA